jgi:NAD/NADP transhydrogenase beta subunit
MSLQVYHFLHIIGLILVFVGFGGLLSSERAKSAMMWHGIGLLISLVSGFGMVAKYAKLAPEGSPSFYTQPWVLAKIGLWLVLGFLPVLAKKRVFTPKVVVLFAMLTGVALAYLGYFKPAL